MNHPRLGITLGDPSGVGPELIIRLILEEALPPGELIIFGQKKILDFWTKKLGWNLSAVEKKIKERKIVVEEVVAPLEEIEVGQPTAESGRASFAFFREAVAKAGSGQLDALVTAPVSKVAWAMAGVNYRGHTEYLEQLYPGCMMSFWSARLKVVLFTHHLPLEEAIKKVRKEEFRKFLLALEKDLQQWPFGVKEVLVSGLNPHAGEAGTMRAQEETEIKPAIQQFSNSWLRISGPYPADTVFLRALDQPGKMVLSLYHDQGLIPFKLVSFFSGVNLTLGLPFLRTSPDHGTAYDLAGKGNADPRSMKEAIWLAWKLITSQQ